MSFRIAGIALFGIMLLGLAGWGVWHHWFPAAPANFKNRGGTLLVYEIDPGPEQADKDWSAATAEVLQRRLDPARSGMTTVLPAGKNRVEIRVTKVDDQHLAEVAKIKEVIPERGQLELRIVANSTDDFGAIEAAEIVLNAPSKQLQAELDDLQRKGLPPPGPRIGNEPQLFTIGLAGGEKSKISYCWVELGPQELAQLNLDHAAEKDPKRNVAWKKMAENRGLAVTISNPDVWDNLRPELGGALFYSRDCRNERLNENERIAKKVEYFVLARNPELDPRDPDGEKQIPMLDSGFLQGAVAWSDLENSAHQAVHFTWNAAGANLMKDLTRKNVPSEKDERLVRRHLAVILDGLVLSVPAINSEIGANAQVSGRLTKREVERIAWVLRGGALPVRINPLPASEIKVLPEK